MSFEDGKTYPVYLSMGSNQGDRTANLRRGVEALRQEISIRRVSSLYETEPVGVVDQPRFLNLAVAAETKLAPLALLNLVKTIESDLGREPTFRWGPRVIDIDIVLYGDLVLQGDRLTLPHPEALNRAFVLVPLAEIAGDVMHPVARRSIRDLAQAVAGKEMVLRQ